MKDNKYAPYILGPILLIVWGLVFYKIYQAVYGGEEAFVIPTFHKIPIATGAIEEKSYTLLLDYKDPFLGKKINGSNSNRTANAMQPRNTTTRPKVVKPNISPPQHPIPKPPFPVIVYQGFQVMELDTVALLKVNKRFYPVAREGDVFQGVQVKKIYKDSIQLIFNNENQTFLKKR